MAQAADEQLTLLIQGTLALNETHRSESEGLLQQASPTTTPLTCANRSGPSMYALSTGSLTVRSGALQLHGPPCN